MNQNGVRRVRLSLLLPALVLVTAVALQLLNGFRTQPAPRTLHLETVIPRDLTGWTSRDLPLGANEFISSAAEKILNYDEFVNREFSHGGLTFSIYVAYWGAGKMPVQLVASHTPDRCWTENGWRCVEQKYRQSYAAAGEKLQPAEWREFLPPVGEAPTYVLFWHLVDGRAYNYGERFNSIPDPLRWCREALRQIVHGNKEQHFIRISSNVPPEEIWTDPGFAKLLQNLKAVGLARVPEGALSSS